VTAQDVVRGFKRLCNPASPVGAPGYYNDTIVGFKQYCDGGLKVKSKADAIASYIKGHDIKGLQAKDKLTVQFHLINPASDFINILSLPFSSPAPKEYLKYVPDSPQLHKNFISDGPYQIKSYTPSRGFMLVRNKAWNPKTDKVRKAYVDKIKITEGVNSQSVQQQLETGTADMSWDQPPPTAVLPRLIRKNDPNLLIGPSGDNFLSINPYMVINQAHKGPLQKLKVRQALEYAVNKKAVANVYGGPKISKPLNQVIPKGSVGHIDGFNPYPDNNGKGDPAKAKKLLKQAGYPNGITLKLLYRTSGVHPKVAQTVSASLKKAGFNVTLVPATGSDFYSKYLENPSAAKRGVWDIAEPGWIPDWAGNNGRSVISPLFDGRTYGPNSTDYGDYNSKVVNAAIDKALSTGSKSTAKKAWQKAARQIMKDAAIVPVNKQKFDMYHSSRVQNCVYAVQNNNCDYTNVWLKQ
jgi:peptide/nickel transport system substrate-binding protein